MRCYPKTAMESRTESDQRKAEDGASPMRLRSAHGGACLRGWPAMMGDPHVRIGLDTTRGESCFCKWQGAGCVNLCDNEGGNESVKVKSPTCRTCRCSEWVTWSRLLQGDSTYSTSIPYDGQQNLCWSPCPIFLLSHEWSGRVNALFQESTATNTT